MTDAQLLEVPTVFREVPTQELSMLYYMWKHKNLELGLALEVELNQRLEKELAQ